MSLERGPLWGAERGGGGGRTRAAHQSPPWQPLLDALSGFQQSPGQAPRGHHEDLARGLPRCESARLNGVGAPPPEAAAAAAPPARNAGRGCRRRCHRDQGPRLQCLRGHRSRESAGVPAGGRGGWRHTRLAVSHLPGPSRPRPCREREQELAVPTPPLDPGSEHWSLGLLPGGIRNPPAAWLWALRPRAPSAKPDKTPTGERNGAPSMFSCLTLGFRRGDPGRWHRHHLLQPQTIQWPCPCPVPIPS